MGKHSWAVGLESRWHPCRADKYPSWHISTIIVNENLDDESNNNVDLIAMGEAVTEKAA